MCEGGVEADQAPVGHHTLSTGASMHLPIHQYNSDGQLVTTITVVQPNVHNCVYLV